MENTNRLLRQHLSRKFDLSALSQHELDMMSVELNERPQETLDWRTLATRISKFVAPSD